MKNVYFLLLILFLFPVIAFSQQTGVTSNAGTQATVSTNATSQTLKQQGLSLAKEINDWVVSLSQNVPVMPNPPFAVPGGQQDPATIKAEVAVAQAYTDKINLQWDQLFATQASSLVTAMHIRGVTFSCTTKQFSDDPSHILSLHSYCAKVIAQAATNLN